MNKRIGFVGIIVEDRLKSSPAVNQVLSEAGELILARVGLPCRQRGVSVKSALAKA